MVGVALVEERDLVGVLREYAAPAEEGRAAVGAAAVAVAHLALEAPARAEEEAGHGQGQPQRAEEGEAPAAAAGGVVLAEVGAVAAELDARAAPRAQAHVAVGAARTQPVLEVVGVCRGGGCGRQEPGVAPLVVPHRSGATSSCLLLQVEERGRRKEDHLEFIFL